jgi:hypothetical protein
MWNAASGTSDGTDEIEVVVGQPVDILRGLAEKPVPSMASVFTSTGGITGTKPAAVAWAIARLSIASCSCAAHSGQEVETRTGHLRAALHVDGAEPTPELDVVERLEVEHRRLADVLEDDVVVLPARRHSLFHDVGQPSEQLVVRRRASVCATSAALTRQRAPWYARAGRLLVTARLGDLAAEVLLLGAELVVARDRLAAARVRGDHGIDEALVLPRARWRRAYGVGVVTDESGIEHARSVSSLPAPRAPITCGAPPAPTANSPRLSRK